MFMGHETKKTFGPKRKRARYEHQKSRFGPQHRVVLVFWKHRRMRKGLESPQLGIERKLGRSTQNKIFYQEKHQTKLLHSQRFYLWCHGSHPY